MNSLSQDPVTDFVSHAATSALSDKSMNCNIVCGCKKYNDKKFALKQIAQTWIWIEALRTDQVRADFFGIFQIGFIGRLQKMLCMY